MNAPLRTTAAAPTEPAADVLASRVLASIAQRGDLSALNDNDRAAHYERVCEGLGLNPASQPFAYMTLNGKLVLYATRGATDQLAAIHKLTREIIDGPKVIDLAGTKLVYAVCRVTHPNGRVETATATCALIDPVNVLMKVETKAKRRATLSILGLGILDEMEIETVARTGAEAPTAAPAAPRAPDAPAPAPAAPAHDPAADPAPPEAPPALETFYARVGEIELPGEAVAVWLKHRAEIEALPSTLDREAAWKALCGRTEHVGKMKNAKVWLKKAIAEEDSRRQMNADRRAA